MLELPQTESVSPYYYIPTKPVPKTSFISVSKPVSKPVSKLLSKSVSKLVSKPVSKKHFLPSSFFYGGWSLLKEVLLVLKTSDQRMKSIPIRITILTLFILPG